MILDFYDSILEDEKVKSVKIIDNGNVSDFITFGVPTFKRVSTLRCTLDSIISQKCSIPFNILVSDNNPDRGDDTEKLMLSSYGSIGGLKYYKHEEPMPPSGNFNKLLSLCHTKYLIMVHDDDYLLPSFLKEMYNAIKILPNASIIKCNEILWDGKTKVPVDVNAGCFYNVSLESLLFEFKIAPTGCVMNVHDLKEIGGFNKETLPATDYALVAQLLKAGKRVVYYSKKLMSYRCCDNDTSNPLTQEKLLLLDKEIKSAIGQIVDFPKWYVKLSIYVSSRMHQAVIRKITKGKKKFQDRVFFFFARIYSGLSSWYFKEKITFDKI